MMKIKAIIFDIGGVILEDPMFGEFWQGKEESKELRQAFGTGKITTDELIEKGSNMLGLKKEEFIKQYDSAYSQMKKIEEVYTFYINLKLPRYIFSDTNPIHTGHCKTLYPEIFTKAEKLFLSYEIGLRKNEDESYKYLLSQIANSPQEILFIDNKEKYINKAREFGINGIIYSVDSNLRSQLNKFGIKI